MTRIVFSFCVLLLLSACQERVGLAPVSEARIERESTPVMYRVKRYDTLYSIAFRYDQDYRSIAQMNRLFSALCIACRAGDLFKNAIYSAA